MIVAPLGLAKKGKHETQGSGGCAAFSKPGCTAVPGGRDGERANDKLIGVALVLGIAYLVAVLSMAAILLFSFAQSVPGIRRYLQIRRM